MKFLKFLNYLLFSADNFSCQKLLKKLQIEVLLFTILFLSISSHSIAQKTKRSFEVNLYTRIDWYPEFSYAINPIRTNYVKIRGESYGLNVGYKFPLIPSLYLKPAIGYYRYAFNDIRNYNKSFGKSKSRNINFPSSVDILYYTDNYWYNTIYGSIGIEKRFAAKKDLQIVTGINLNNYYTYLQGYHIIYDNPDDPITNPFKRKDNRIFGFSTNISAGVLKQVGKISIGPSLIIPVFNSWKQDNIFPGETNVNTRNKWLRGIGAGITLNF